NAPSSRVAWMFRASRNPSPAVIGPVRNRAKFDQTRAPDRSFHPITRVILVNVRLAAGRPPCHRCGSAARSRHGGRGPEALSAGAARYSWLPGTGLKRMPRKAKPSGLADAASSVTAVQMMLVEVAAMAAVPWATTPALNEPSE